MKEQDTHECQSDQSAREVETLRQENEDMKKKLSQMTQENEDLRQQIKVKDCTIEVLKKNNLSSQIRSFFRNKKSP